MLDLSIIIVNYKTEALILDCLNSIKKFDAGFSYELIVIDNCYEPGANKQIVSDFPGLKWIDAGGNIGFSRANNLGLSNSVGKYVLFLNADTLIIDNSIFNALNFLKSNSAFVAVGGLQVDLNGNPLPYYSTLNEIRKDLYILPNKPVFQKLILALLPTENFSNGETNNLVGAFILTTKTALQKVGNWDEDFFMYAEDAELSFRLSKIGKLTYLENVKFVHLINENEFRRTEYSWANRFSVQVQLSNFLWIRKSYGIFPLLILYFNYILLVPSFWVWKFYKNLSEGKKMFANPKNQRLLDKKVRILLNYLPSLMFAKKKFFKIKQEENIDKINS